MQNSYTEKTEDNVGIVLHNALVGILRLAKVGLTRELPILGCIDGWYILGVIDELKINDGKLQVIERKTRKSNRSPSPSQLLVHKIQGMLYYKLLSRLQKDNVDYWKEFAEAYDLDLNAKMSDEYLELLVERGVVEEKNINFEKNLRKKATYFVDILKKLPPLHEEILLIYENQDTGEIIDSVKVPFDEKWIHENKICKRLLAGEERSSKSFREK